MGIQTLEVSGADSLVVLKKAFRKKLMTGGAIVGLPSLLSEIEQEELVCLAKEEAQHPGLARLILLALAKHQDLSAGIAEKLSQLEVVDISRALYERPDLATTIRSKLKAEQSLNKVEIRNIEERRYSEALLKLKNDNQRRVFFLANIASSSAGETARKTLLGVESLPSDLLFLLKRDPASSVRFAARSYFKS